MKLNELFFVGAAVFFIFPYIALLGHRIFFVKNRDYTTTFVLTLISSLVAIGLDYLALSNVDFSVLFYQARFYALSFIIGNIVFFIEIIFLLVTDRRTAQRKRG